jgi:FkbM family methyltransferase
MHQGGSFRRHALNIFVRRLLPNKPLLVAVLRGPFRGARLLLNPRHSLRKIFGLYEHELNQWIEQALHLVDKVVDVGANDGYFTFGCAAAFRRLKKPGRIIAFEPQAKHFAQLQMSEKHRQERGAANVEIWIEQRFVGNEEFNDNTTLDAVANRPIPSIKPRNALVKVDVEGAEIDVIEGASSWLDHSNLFLIEVHNEAFIERIKERFAARSLHLKLIKQSPLPIIGYEHRQKENCWLVSQIN